MTQGLTRAYAQAASRLADRFVAVGDPAFTGIDSYPGEVPAGPVPPRSTQDCCAQYSSR